MLISIMDDSIIRTYYYAFIIDYESISPVQQPFRLIVMDQKIKEKICDSFFISAELAMEHFYTFFVRRTLCSESISLEIVSPKYVEWSEFNDLFKMDKVIKSIFSALTTVLNMTSVNGILFSNGVIDYESIKPNWLST